MAAKKPKRGTAKKRRKLTLKKRTVRDLTTRGKGGDARGGARTLSIVSPLCSITQCS